MKGKRIIYIVAGVLFTAFAYYTISPLFITVTVDESVPGSSGVREQSPPITVTGTSGHPASGTVRVIDAEGKKYIRYENYQTINGPDIYVYLSKDLAAKDFVSLGRVKGTEGNINYEIPPDINIDEYPYILTWCKAFGVLFNYAKIQGAE